MSKIYIKEVDLTTVETANIDGNDVVYIPGFSSLANSTLAAPVGVPVLCKTIAEFETAFGTKPAVFAATQEYPAAFKNYAVPTVGLTPSPMFINGDVDPSYIYAKELLAQGLPVVYERVNTYASLEDAGSMELYDVTVAKMYEFLSSHFSTSTNVGVETSIAGATVSIDSATFVNNYPSAGNYTLTAVTAATPSTNMTGGNIEVNYDKYISHYTTTMTFTANISDITTRGTTNIVGASVNVNTNTFKTAYTTAGTYVFTYNGTSNKWEDADGDEVTLSNIGVELVIGTGTVVNGSTITVILSFTVTWKDTSNQEAILPLLGIVVTAGNPVVGGTSTITITLDPINVGEGNWTDPSGAPHTLGYYGINLTATSIAPLDTITVSEVKAEPTLMDKSYYNVKYLTSGGYPVFEYSGRSISQQMANLAAARGDCIALIDHTNNPNRELVGISSVYTQANMPDNMLTSTTASYGAMFTPWGNYNLINSYSNLATTTYPLPPSYAYLAGLANSILANPSWLAIAGAARGKVTGLSSTNISKVITNSIADSYTPDNAVCVNPMTNIRPYGQCIWGNRTLVDNSLKGGTTALSFLNIRNLVSDVKKQLFLACQSLLFEQNTDVLWVNFLSAVTPLLDKMVSGYGISNYKIIRENPSDRSVITATIRLYPVYAVESFDLTIYLQNGDVEVEE